VSGDFRNDHGVGVAVDNDYNKRAKPFRWAHDSRPLQAA
jgi:hypothetical protein